MKFKAAVPILLVFALTLTGCLGTFQTARVVPLRIGALYYGAAGTDADNSLAMPGLFIEGGWPAGPGRFGIGLNLKLLTDVGSGDNNSFLGVWGAKLQLPENHMLDIAVGVDVWAYYPGELKLFLSRRIGILEPYACVGAANFLRDDDDDDIDFFGDGIFTFTGGTMVRLGSDSGWLIGAEVEGGSAWNSTGFGFSLLKEF